MFEFRRNDVLVSMVAGTVIGVVVGLGVSRLAGLPDQLMLGLVIAGLVATAAFHWLRRNAGTCALLGGSTVGLAVLAFAPLPVAPAPEGQQLAASRARPASLWTNRLGAFGNSQGQPAGRRGRRVRYSCIIA